MNPFPLSDLPLGQTGRIQTLSCDPSLRRRLADLGLIPGTSISCVHISPAGSPMAFSIRGAIIALRKQDCLAISYLPQ